MRRCVKDAARQSMERFGFFSLARRLTAHLPRIIMYHGFCGPGESVPRCMPVDIFRRQLRYIKRFYKPLKLRDLVTARLRDGRFPMRVVVITVDDGYINFYRWALPLLREFEVPATVFVVSEIVDRSGWLWVDQVRYLCENSRGIKILADEKPLTKELMRMRIPQRDYCLAKLAERAKVSLPIEAPPEYAVLSWAQLAEVVDSGLIEIGSHTCTHPILARLNSEDSWNELYGSRCKIRENLGVPVDSFAFPNGAREDYREEQVEMLGKAGYRCGTVTDFGYVKKQSNIYTLPRISGDARGGINAMISFLERLNGVDYLRRWVFQ